MRVLIISQYYWPEPIPKLADLAEALSAAGDDVTVITGFPNYPSGDLYPGYRMSLVSREEIRGVRVIRAYVFAYHGTRALGRAANYLSFMITAPIASLFAPKVDVMYVFHPPTTIGVAAWIIGRVRRIPFVYDVQDIWPEAVVLSGLLKPGFWVSMLSALERFVYQRAAHIFAVTPGARENIISKGVEAKRVSAMPHWFDGANFGSTDPAERDRLRTAHGWTGKFVLIFAGNTGLVQGLETVVRAAEILRDQAGIKLVIIGDGTDRPRLVALAKSLEVTDRLEFIERQPLARMPGFMAAADGLLVHLKWSKLSDYVIPTKTLAYLASWNPIVMAMNGAAADLVKEAGAGLVVEPDDPAKLAASVLDLAGRPPEERAAMGARGRRFLDEHLAKDLVIPKYRVHLQRLAEGSNA